MPIITFLSSPSGRLLRFTVGLALIIVGLLLGGGWIAIAVVGLVPLLAAMFNTCLIGSIMGRGPRVHAG